MGIRWKSFPKSICNLLHSERLYLFDHDLGLKVLPDALCKLEMFKKLELQNFQFLKRLPTDLGCFSSLQQLHIWHCTKVVELPSTICNLFQLQEMNLWHSNNLKHLPKDFNKLIKLFELITCGCDKLEWWEPNQSSILKKFKDIGCRMQLFCVMYDIDDLIQLIDDGAPTNKRIQVIKETQSHVYKS